MYITQENSKQRFAEMRRNASVSFLAGLERTKIQALVSILLNSLWKTYALLYFLSSSSVNMFDYTYLDEQTYKNFTLLTNNIS